MNTLDFYCAICDNLLTGLIEEETGYVITPIKCFDKFLELLPETLSEAIQNKSKHFIINRSEKAVRFNLKRFCNIVGVEFDSVWNTYAQKISKGQVILEDFAEMTIEYLKFKFEHNHTDPSKNFTCSVCGGTFYGMGNDAHPLTNGKCCDACMEFYVIPERLKKW